MSVTVGMDLDAAAGETRGSSAVAAPTGYGARSATGR